MEPKEKIQESSCLNLLWFKCGKYEKPWSCTVFLHYLFEAGTKAEVNGCFLFPVSGRQCRYVIVDTQQSITRYSLGRTWADRQTYDFYTSWLRFQNEALSYNYSVLQQRVVNQMYVVVCVWGAFSSYMMSASASHVADLWKHSHVAWMWRHGECCLGTLCSPSLITIWRNSDCLVRSAAEPSSPAQSNSSQWRWRK